MAITIMIEDRFVERTGNHDIIQRIRFESLLKNNQIDGEHLLETDIGSTATIPVPTVLPLAEMERIRWNLGAEVMVLQ